MDVIDDVHNLHLVKVRQHGDSCEDVRRGDLHIPDEHVLFTVAIVVGDLEFHVFHSGTAPLHSCP